MSILDENLPPLSSTIPKVIELASYSSMKSFEYLCFG